MRPRLRAGELLGSLPITAFLLLPPLALGLRGGSGSLATLRDPSTRTAIEVSLKTTSISIILLVIFGAPLCQFLAHQKGFFSRVLDAMIDLPVVLPPAAAGIGLLVAFGRNGLIPTHLPFSVGAVICAQVFVAAPLFIRSGVAAISSVAPEIIETARTEGVGGWPIFWRVVIPIGGPTFMAGIVLAWARALGEFGATLLFAGNLPGRTQTMPLAIYLGFETDLDQAIGLSVILLFVAGLTLLASKLLISPRPHLDSK